MRQHTLIASILACSMIAGCASDSTTSGEQPGILTPSKDTKASETASVGNVTVTRSADRVLADVQGIKVSESQVLPILFEGYGLDVMLKVMQLNMAKETAARNGKTVSPADIEAERNLTLSLAFGEEAKPEDYDQLLTQLLSQQRVSRAEFGVLMETNAYLRACIKAAAAAEITDDLVRAEFNTLYGERVRVRHIAVSNLQEIAAVQRRLTGTPAKDGAPAIPPEPFERVAAELSQHPVTAKDGGEMPAFSRTTPGISQVFAQAAFSLNPGEVSVDAVQDGGYYHIIKLVEKLPPRGQKFEDVRESVRVELIRRRENNLMAGLRQQFAQAALNTIAINDPAMKKQFDERVAAANPKPAEREEVRKSLDVVRERLNAPPKPATAPAAQP